MEKEAYGWLERLLTQAEQEENWLVVFHNACAVYLHYRQSGQHLKAINPSCDPSRHVKAEILDLLCDLDLKARRECKDPRDWHLVQNCAPELLPKPLQLRLGAAWMQIYEEYSAIFNILIKAQHREQQRELRKAQRDDSKAARCLDDGAYALYAEERAAVELLETQEENSNDEAA